MKNITIEFLGHACFRLDFGGYTVVLDPYEDGSVRGIGPIRDVKADVVFASHGHHDHNAVHLVQIEDSGLKSPVIEEVETFHDNEGGAKRGMNTVRIFEYEDVRIAHFGDLGHLLDAGQIAAIGKVDIALMPVGGFFTVDPLTAKKVAESLDVGTIIPMHYKTKDFGFDVIADVSEFTKLFDDVLYADTSVLEVGDELPAKVVVLKPRFQEK
ncbi:MAG: MBL fold metallo-hydrolase [Oscillospiraceae bacterium]|nr:MBL fold metallo-hydrolase [Oscillospiraceae bacterium]